MRSRLVNPLYAWIFLMKTPKNLQIANATGPANSCAHKRLSVWDRLNEIAALYDELAAGQDPGPTDRD